MKYFLDTEFIEGTQKKLFGNSIPTIDLISIGIVAEDGREYYAISNEFNIKEAWNRYDIKSMSGKGGIGENTHEKVYWIRENVLKPIWKELIEKERKYYLEMFKRINVWAKYIDDDYYKFTYKEFKRLIKTYGKTNKQIAEEIYEFCSNDYHKGNNLTFSQRKEYPLYDKFKPEFYGYYSDYDWVVFCWLFGKMNDLPNGFPMYCNDLKQTLDEKANSLTSMELSKLVYPNCNHNVFELLDNPSFNLTHLGCLKSHSNYPKQTNEHNALADAKWNKELYHFLQKL